MVQQRTYAPENTSLLWACSAILVLCFASVGAPHREPHQRIADADSLSLPSAPVIGYRAGSRAQSRLGGAAPCLPKVIVAQIAYQIASALLEIKTTAENHVNIFFSFYIVLTCQIYSWITVYLSIACLLNGRQWRLLSFSQVLKVLFPLQINGKPNK